MTQQVAQEFNSLLHGTLNKYERYGLKGANSNGRIYLCPRFIYICMEREGRETLRNTWGIGLNHILTPSRTGGIYYQNYNLRPDAEYDSIPYPDLFYQKRFGQRSSALADVGRECETMEEVKQTVRNWIFESVVPLHLEHLFT